MGALIGFTTPAAGKFNGGVLTLFPLAPGGSIDYTIIGWTGSGESMDAAMARGSVVDVSRRFTSATGNPTLVPPDLPVPLSASFGGLHITYIPEPTSFAMTFLGAAILLAFRRRE